MTNITRRNFLKISAAGTATAILAGCSQESERWVTLEPYVRAPEEQLAGVPNYYATTCRQCPAGCGVIVRIMNGRAVKLEGNPEHPVNRGKLCARGQAGLQLLYNPDRVTGAARQEERGSREFESVAWNDAINAIYERIEAAGSGIGVWLGSTTSGHLVDLFARFADAIGAPAPVRYDLYSGFHGYHALETATGSLIDAAGLPTYDLGGADAVFSFGADFLGTWLSSTGYGVEFGRFRSQPLGQRGFLVQFEPKMSITGAKADRWVPLRPGTEALVAQAIARIIADEGFGAADRVERAGTLAGNVDIEEAAAACEMPVEALVELARVFATADHPLALPGSTVAGANNAAEAIAAIQALNIIAGTVGQPGGMSIIPALPDALLAAPPSSTFADTTALIERMNAGEIKVLLVHGANPAFDLPAGAGFVEALANVDLVVSFNPLVDETSVHADYILPDRVYLEGWGYSVATPAFGGLPVISSQQPVVGPLYDIRSTGDVLLTVARGIPAAAQALPWTDEVAFIKEMITALPTGAAGGEDEEVRWARYLQHGGWWPVEAAAETPTIIANAPASVPPTTYQGDEGEYPYHLHLFMSVLLGDGSGASQPWLQSTPDPMTTVSWQTWVEINPATARDLGLDHGDIVEITSPQGAIRLPVYIFPAIRPDTVAIPIGQGHQDLGRYARNRGENPLALVGLETDASGNYLAWSNVRVAIRKTDDTRALPRLESTIETDEEVHIPF